MTLFLAALFAADCCAQDSTAVYVMQTDGTAVRKIAEAPGFKRVGHPRWSHDGKRLAFHAWDGPPGIRRVFVVNSDASQAPEAGPDGQFADWSPDDKQLAFQLLGEANRAGSWVQNLDGSGRTLLVDGSAPRWSPDGGQLAFIENRELIVRDLVDESQRSLLEGNWEEIKPGFDWAADGKQIAFVARREGRLGLWIVGTKDPKPRLRLAGNLMGHVSWSPDGKRLAITLDSLIHVLNADDALPPRAVPGQTGNSRDPAWSPDGKRIAFSSNRDVKGP